MKKNGSPNGEVLTRLKGLRGIAEEPDLTMMIEALGVLMSSLSDFEADLPPLGMVFAEMVRDSSILDSSSEVGLFEDFYPQIFEILSNNFALDCDVLEVASGYNPTFAKMIRKHQNKGTMTVYDPRLSRERFKGIKSVRKPFTLSTVQHSDLMISLAPCEVEELFIQKVKLAQTPMFLVPCGCREGDAVARTTEQEREVLLARVNSMEQIFNAMTNFNLAREKRCEVLEKVHQERCEQILDGLGGEFLLETERIPGGSKEDLNCYMLKRR